MPVSGAEIDEFVGGKVVSPSYSSAILWPHLRNVIFLKWMMSLVESLKQWLSSSKTQIHDIQNFFFSKLVQLMFSSTLKYKKQFYSFVQGFYVGEKIRITF